MNHRKSRTASMKYMLAGGSVVAAFSLLVDPTRLLPSPAAKKEVCQEVVQSKTVLSRDQLSKLIAIPERSNKAQVRQVVKEPYCKLPNLQIRVGATSQREAYPLSFDSQTWLIVLYEGDEYAGYRFSFHH